LKTFEKKETKMAPIDSASYISVRNFQNVYLHLNQTLHHYHYCHYFHPLQITGPDPSVEEAHPCPRIEGLSPPLQQIKKEICNK
jgi:hypothetical protein